VDGEPGEGATALVVELFADEGRHWQVRVLGQGEPALYALAPVTLVVRLWRVPNSEAVRGSVSVGGSGEWAGFQYSDRLALLVRDWLAGDTPGT
jgi:hypothetical protein